MLKCDLCGVVIETPIFNYLLLHSDNTYEGDFSGDYFERHAHHEKAKHDVMICVPCYQIYLDRSNSVQRVTIPPHIPQMQVKRFMLTFLKKEKVNGND